MLPPDTASPTPVIGFIKCRAVSTERTILSPFTKEYRVHAAISGIRLFLEGSLQQNESPNNVSMKFILKSLIPWGQDGKVTEAVSIVFFVIIIKNSLFRNPYLTKMVKALKILPKG
ncbi:hypothetical protein DKX38_019483 [Salix brachista]|uniref:Uncharacterized protein n=1 Tax=Salix brachista TaxID=2182728 RepID=A0A5N5KGB7_9ROSI|nr:hypothetical protein DKX38_019483 [Salix brachista]